MTISFLLALSLTARADSHHDDGHHDDGHHDDDRTCEPGSTDVLAYMPVDQVAWPPTGPTYPEGIAVLGDRIIVSGPANFGTAGNGSPSQLTVFDRESGELLSEVPVIGENTDYEHALSELTVHGRYAYAPSTQLGVLRWDFRGHTNTPTQQNISTPFCSVTGSFPCHTESDACPADIRPGLPPLPNGISVGDDEVVYVTDALQGIVWRIGSDGVPTVLICAPELQGSGDSGLTLFGANGLTIDGDFLYVGVTFGPMSAYGPTSVIYRIDVTNPELELVYSFDPVQVAPGVFVPPVLDGLRYDEENERLLAVLGGQNAVVELDLSEEPMVEVARYTRTGVDTPFYNPSTVAFDDEGNAYVTNHAIMACLEGDPTPGCTDFGAAEDFAVIQVCRE